VSTARGPRVQVTSVPSRLRPVGFVGPPLMGGDVVGELGQASIEGGAGVACLPRRPRCADGVVFSAQLLLQRGQGPVVRVGVVSFQGYRANPAGQM
jgi:hypothetical protein